MTISANSVRFDDATMWVAFKDGRILGVPLAWFPKLATATAEERGRVEITPFGLHWKALDEDISVPALLADNPRMAAVYR